MNFRQEWVIINWRQGECLGAILCTPLWSALSITWGRGVMCHSASLRQCERTLKVFPTSSPRLVLVSFYLAFLCPRLYWAEYFYVANVVKVSFFFINVFCTLVKMWFCLLQLKRLWAFPIAILTYMACVSLLPSKESLADAVPQFLVISAREGHK